MAVCVVSPQSIIISPEVVVTEKLESKVTVERTVKDHTLYDVAGIITLFKTDKPIPSPNLDIITIVYIQTQLHIVVLVMKSGRKM